MEKDNNTIEKSLSEIKKVMEDNSKEKIISEKAIKDEKIEAKSEYFLLEKIVSTSKRNEKKINQNENKDTLKDNKIKSKQEILNSNKKIKKKNESDKTSQNKTKRKNNDPMALVVEREIKPIIKKWINKNLRSFVKAIVIEEMKQISRATEKRTFK
tara:strand:- start:462 stop:929 length:468 start_codon:yes stop_codon:yes gene_type:complete